MKELGKELEASKFWEGLFVKSSDMALSRALRALSTGNHCQPPPRAGLESTKQANSTMQEDGVTKPLLLDLQVSCTYN